MRFLSSRFIFIFLILITLLPGDVARKPPKSFCLHDPSHPSCIEAANEPIIVDIDSGSTTSIPPVVAVGTDDGKTIRPSHDKHNQPIQPTTSRTELSGTYSDEATNISEAQITGIIIYI